MSDEPPVGELHEDFGDPETLLNSRDWLQDALEKAGAKFDGGAGIGMGQADVDIILEGCKFNVSIRPRVKLDTSGITLSVEGVHKD